MRDLLQKEGLLIAFSRTGRFRDFQKCRISFREGFMSRFLQEIQSSGKEPDHGMSVTPQEVTNLRSQGV